ncbi:cytochrome P450 [Streptomyces sp. NPDC056255]|uniref:cytochrome P450 n=1 Tax=Streptomyces sp. NPDC056255 TaxID=3345764 RepID=UPI0035DB1E10
MTELLPDAIWLPNERPSGCPYNPPEQLSEIREKTPLSRIYFSGDAEGWLVTSHALGRQVLADSRFSSGSYHRAPIKGAPAMETPPPPPPGFLSLMDPPDHTRYRKQLTGEFTVRRMRQLTERIEEITSDCLDDMEKQEGSVDLVEAFARRIPGVVISELLGVSYDDRQSFFDLVDHMHSLGRSKAPVEEQTKAYMAVRSFMSELMLAKRNEPTDDLFSGLATSDFTDEEIINLGLTLLGAGLDTVAGTFALGAFALLRNPEQYAVLGEAADSDAVGRAIEEILRYTAVLPVLTRTALEDVELDGHLIKTGDMITVSTAAANRDADKFGAPDDLDLTRSARGHLSFGHGIHQCVAQQLARVELQVAFPALAKRFPTLRLAVEPEEVPVRDEIAFYGLWKLPVTWDQA